MYTAMMTSSWRTWSIVHQVFLFFYNVEISGSCKACSIEQISVSNIEPCPCFSCCGESRILNVFSTQRGKLIILYAFICKGTAFRSMLFVVWTLDIMHVLVSYVLVPSKPTYNLQHMLRSIDDSDGPLQAYIIQEVRDDGERNMGSFLPRPPL